MEWRSRQIDGAETGREAMRIGRKVMPYGMVALLVAALLPVMILGRYNHATGDDYFYGADTHLVWEETGSIFKTLAEAADGVALEYERWQGTYSAMFLMYLPPQLFGDWAYRLVTTGILLLLVGAIFSFTKTVLCRFMGYEKDVWVVSGSALSLLCVETVPTPAESFFWYNGSMYYTGYLALTLFFLGMLLRYLQTPSAGRLIGAICLGFFLAGGNYVTLLPCLILVAFICAWALWKRLPARWGLLAVLGVTICGLGISALAPGTRIRQDGMWQIPAWKAVAKSLVQGLLYMQAWIGLWWIAVAALLAVVLWKPLRSASFRFPYPVCAIGLLYGIFCSMSCPTFYTMNSTGPARVVAVVYYGFVLFSFAAYIYLMGYLHRWWRERKEAQAAPEEAAKDASAPVPAKKTATWKSPRYLVVGAAVVVWVLALAFGGQMRVTTTAKAMDCLLSGEAARYEQEYQARRSLLTDPAVADVVLEPFETRPELLYVGDFSPDPLEPTNQKVAQYFKKRSVRVNYSK